jgi:hypothetical protein
MNQKHFKRVILNAALILVLTAITGFLYGQVVIEQLTTPGASVDTRAWNMAHLECLLNALLMLSVATATKFLTVGQKQSSTLSWALIICGWTNAIASTSSALTGGRGAIPTGMDWNTFNHGLFLLGVLAFLVMIVILLTAIFNTNET